MSEPLFEVPFAVDHAAIATTDGTKFVVTRIDTTSDVWIADDFAPDVPRE